MSRTLEWNTLQEAANYLTGELRENWTPRMVLDAGEKELFKVRFVLPHDTKAWAGRTEEWVGDKAELLGPTINALLNDGTARVGFVPFTDPKTKEKTLLELKPRPQISFDEIRIKGSELVTFTSPSNEAILGKMPNVKIGQLAIRAAMQIENGTGKRATAKQVIEMLQSWVDHKDNPEAVTELTEKIPNGVKWVTSAGKESDYDINACQKTLETWNKSRARNESSPCVTNLAPP